MGSWRTWEAGAWSLSEVVPRWRGRLERRPMNLNAAGKCWVERKPGEVTLGRGPPLEGAAGATTGEPQSSPQVLGGAEAKGGHTLGHGPPPEGAAGATTNLEALGTSRGGAEAGGGHSWTKLPLTATLTAAKNAKTLRKKILTQRARRSLRIWIPAFAGMTARIFLTQRTQRARRGRSDDLPHLTTALST